MATARRRVKSFFFILRFLSDSLFYTVPPVREKIDGKVRAVRTLYHTGRVKAILGKATLYLDFTKV